MQPEDLSRLNRGRSEGILHSVRQIIRGNLTAGRDEFLDTVDELFSESKTQAKE